ncbi:MAG TPA: type II toxin-antitoxin system VapC family toxin [Hyphomicrobiales bacterium]|nr:type II toxin-antitoxin system VapC family toxin [Hyphomicrobiales bacterium]
MILADSSVWIDHFRGIGDAVMVNLLNDEEILMHPFVLGELALGHLRPRIQLLAMFRALPQADVATDDEVLELIEYHSLEGSGIGYVDAHLLAATTLMPGAAFWTRDRRLRDVAERLRLLADLN